MTGEVTLTGQRAADRRPEGEGAGRPAGGDQAGHRARPQRARSRGLPASRCARTWSSSGSPTSRRSWTRRSRRGIERPDPRVCSLPARARSDREGSMAAKKKAAKAGAAAVAVKNSPYVQRLVEDEELRENIAAGLRVRPLGREPLLERQVAHEGRLRRQEAPEGRPRAGRVAARRGRRPARGPAEASAAAASASSCWSAIVGAGLALALSEGLRKKVLDTLFGAEEEFEYSSATTASPPVTPAQTGRLHELTEGRPGGRPSSLHGPPRHSPPGHTGRTGMSQTIAAATNAATPSAIADARPGSAAARRGLLRLALGLLGLAPARGRAPARPRRTRAPASPGRSG